MRSCRGRLMGECPICHGPCLEGESVNESRSEVLRDRAKVIEALNDLYRPEAHELWLGSPNLMLDGRKPHDLIEAGEAERVLDLISALCEGVIF